jgi:heptose I phosphotransferase
MEQLSLSDEFRRLWQGRDPFAEVDRLEGEVFRQVKTRRTIRFTAGGRGYFAKIYHGTGWWEILKELLQFKIPVLGARNEWEALNLLHELGVDTMTPVAFGCRGRSPAHLHSFLITEELTGTRSLEQLCLHEWQARPPAFRMKKALIERVAASVGRMHRHGMNHRDCYICHFHLEVPPGWEQMPPDELRLYVIDLHRAQRRHLAPRRWFIKDVAGLYFSAMDAGLTRADRLRFIRAYEQKPLRDVLHRRRRFWKSVERTALALYRKHSPRVS